MQDIFVMQALQLQNLLMGFKAIFAHLDFIVLQEVHQQLDVQLESTILILVKPLMQVV